MPRVFVANPSFMVDSETGQRGYWTNTTEEQKPILRELGVPFSEEKGKTQTRSIELRTGSYKASEEGVEYNVPVRTDIYGRARPAGYTPPGTHGYVEERNFVENPNFEEQRVAVRNPDGTTSYKFLRGYAVVRDVPTDRPQVETYKEYRKTTYPPVVLSAKTPPKTDYSKPTPKPTPQPPQEEKWTPTIYTPPPEFLPGDMGGYLNRWRQLGAAEKIGMGASTYSERLAQTQGVREAQQGLEYAVPLVGGGLAFLGAGVISTEKSIQSLSEKSAKSPLEAYGEVAVSPLFILPYAGQAYAKGGTYGLAEYSRDIAMQAVVFGGAARGARAGVRYAGYFKPEISLTTNKIIGKEKVFVEKSLLEKRTGLRFNERQPAIGNEKIPETIEERGYALYKIAERPYEFGTKYTLKIEFPNIKILKTPKVGKSPTVFYSSKEYVFREKQYPRIETKENPAIAGKPAYPLISGAKWVEPVETKKFKPFDFKPTESEEGTIVETKGGTAQILKQRQKIKIETKQETKIELRQKAKTQTIQLEKIETKPVTTIRPPVLISIQKTKQEQKQKQSIIYKPTTWEQVMQRVAVKQKQKQEDSLLFLQRSKQMEATDLVEKTKQKTATETATKQLQKTATLTNLKNLEKTISITIPKIAEPPKPKLFKPEPGVFKKFEENKEIGYLVEVKKGGVFKRLTDKPLIKSEALARGLAAVKGGAAQTFKIFPAGYAVGKQRPFSFGELRVPKTIKPLKAGEEVYSQKPAFRISTRGEFEEITLKGIKSRKKRWF